MSCLRLIVVASLLFASACAHVDEPKESEGADSDTTFIDDLVATNRVLSKMIDDAADEIDAYVANQRTVSEPNQSRLVLYNRFLISEGGKREYFPRIGAKLHLPNLQEKLQVRFTTYDEDAEERGINENRQAPTQQEKSYGTSVALFQQLGNVSTEFRPRVEYIDGLLTSYLFRFSSVAERGAFSIEPELQLFARSDSGTGQFLATNLALKLTKVDHLRIYNEEQYTDGDNTMRTNHGFGWERQLTEDMSLRNALIFESNNRETYHLDQYVFSTAFRHRLLRNVLHYSVTPIMVMAKSRSFHPLASLDLRFEVIF